MSAARLCVCNGEEGVFRQKEKDLQERGSDGVRKDEWDYGNYFSVLDALFIQKRQMGRLAVIKIRKIPYLTQRKYQYSKRWKTIHP